jgi:YD repeat-containing protein
MGQTPLQRLQVIKAFRVFVVCTRIRTIATVLALIAGCGGDPGVADVPPETPNGVVLTGALSAPRTAGVSYETATQSGLTDEEGAFLYHEGESVRFFVGDTTLGEAMGKPEVNPFDLAGIEPLTTGAPGFQADRKQVSRAANVATLLQTFDHDGDPSNGIAITPEVAALFDGVEVDLERDIFDFAREQSFRSVLNRANESALLANHRPPRGGIAVMDKLYAELGLSPGFFASRHETTDQDGDGEVDRTRDFTYEAQSSQVVLTDFRSTDRSKTTASAFDEDGNAVSTVESSPQGDVILSKRWETDDDGNLVRMSRDLSGDGTVDSSEAYEYDESGRLLRRAGDLDGDGVTDRMAHYEYDERGNLTRFEWDNDGDGTPDRIEVRGWNEKRDLVTLEIDKDGDSWFETLEISDYDESGRLLGRALYPAGDADPSEMRLWQYDAQGLLIRVSEDHDADGTPESIVHYEYDDAGRLIAEESDDDGNGEPDRVQRRAYGANGYLTRLEHDFDADGTIDFSASYAYDEQGNRFLQRIDRDADGIADEIVRHSFAPAGWGYAFYELRDRSATSP